MAKTSNYVIKLNTALDLAGVQKDLRTINKKENRLEIKVNIKLSDKAIERVKELNDLLSRTQALNNYTNSLKNIQETMKSYEKIASKTVTATKNLAQASENTNQNMKSLGQTSTAVFDKFNKWALVSKTWGMIYHQLTGLVDTVKQLDISFTELSKVTDLTVSDFDDITDKAYNLGSEVAKTTTEVIDAMTEFAKAGYSVEESTGLLAKNALIWTNIADGTVSAAEASNMLISVMKAFDIEAKDSTKIINSLNEVSNNYAISSGQLSDSLTRSASVLAATGTTFEEQLRINYCGNRSCS